jgi:hypothetical protein
VIEDVAVVSLMVSSGDDAGITMTNERTILGHGRCKGESLHFLVGISSVGKKPRDTVTEIYYCR